MALEDMRILGDPGSDAFRLDHYPFYLLNRLVSRYNTLITERLRRIDLDVPYWRVLMTLGDRSPRGVSEIADMAVINLSTMTRIIQRMAAANLVSCQPNATDARVTEVSLTPTGAAKLAEARAASAPLYHSAIRDFSEADFKRLVTLLADVQANLDDNPAPL